MRQYVQLATAQAGHYKEPKALHVAKDKDYPMPKRTANPTYLANRRALLADKPDCHWCGQPNATEADHMLEHDAGGTDELDNLVPACKPCNAKRGALYLAQKKKHQAKARQAFFDNKLMPPTPSFPSIAKEPARTGQDQPELAGVGVIESSLPRLRTIVPGGNSYGPQIVAFAKQHMDVDLMPWQQLVLDDVFTHVDGKFVHRTGLVSVARQNGKTTMLEAIVLWLLIDYPRVVGHPVSILSTAHHLDLAVESFTAIADVLEERFSCKVTRAYGRNFVIAPDGSTWKVTASTGKKHGGTYDFILGDELWALTEAAVFGALRPSQIAVPNPLMLLFSTAGDESSTVFQQLREQALTMIDKNTPGDLYFAEWSVPPGMDPGDERWWPYSNPALGKTITMDGLRSAHNAPDKVQFMRAHLNQWVSAAGSWLEPGLWAALKTKEPMPAGGVLAIETSLDDSRFVGVRAAADGDRVHCQVEFVVGTEAEAWAEVQRVMTDHAVMLAVTPSLEIHLPPFTNKRFTIVGYNELLKYTGLVRTMITEERVHHRGEQILAEHVNRAVLVKTVQGAVLSSQKSPGPIELTRCLVWAAAMVSRPTRAQRPLLVVGRG